MSPFRPWLEEEKVNILGTIARLQEEIEPIQRLIEQQQTKLEQGAWYLDWDNLIGYPWKDKIGGKP